MYCIIFHTMLYIPVLLLLNKLSFIHSFIVAHLVRREGIPPVKWRPLSDRACTSGALWRIGSALEAASGGYVVY